MPHFTFSISANETSVDVSDPLWSRPLPLSRHQGIGLDASDSDATITYSEYFTAVQQFIKQQRLADLILAVQNGMGQSVALPDLDNIHVYLEKHGQFYHPARLVVDVFGRRLSFVVNVAVTPIGRSYLRKDFDNIRTLNRRFPYRFLPQVYAHGVVFLGSQHAQRMEMFLGQWLDEFHEFHLSGEPVAGNNRLLVWDTRQGAQRLSTEARRDVYRQAAQILTAYYNLETFEQISSWHHAAGDFIVKSDGHRLDVRLITVREYAPIIDATGSDAETVVQALLLFLLNLSIKMRLDRRDGVGAITWASEDAVAATLNGFIDGLFLQVENDRIPGELVVFFAAYLKSLTAIEFSDVLDAVFERTFKQTHESDTIRQQLKPHAQSLFNSIAGLKERGINPNMKCMD